MAAEASAKRLKAGDDAITIATHSGAFHADEALAVHMLRAHVPLYVGARLVRTRDPAALQACHTVVDVGGEYEPARNRFDHHQRSFATTFPGRPTKLSSAGLVYMHFGRGIIARRLLLLGDGNGDSDAAKAVTAAVATVAQDSSNIDDAQQNNDRVGLIWRKLYEAFIEAADAHDNGISQYDPAGLAAAGLEKRFSAGGFTLGAMVARLNGMWNDDSAPGDAQVAEDGRFELASRRIGEEFDRALDFYTRGWMPARAIVAEAYAARRTHDPEGRVVVLPGGKGVPWKEHIFSLEEEDEAAAAAAAEKDKGEKAGDTATSRVLYVMYKEGSAPDAKWRMQCMPESQDSFQSRKPLPEAWRGLRDEELSNVSGIDGGVFVHASGFTGGNKTYEGAMEMVKKSLAYTTPPRR